MPNAQKVAVSLPDATLKKLERYRRKRGKSRSAAVAEAIEYWLRAKQGKAADLRYLQSYLQDPEHVEAVATTAQQVVSTWEPWE
jgi:metal-responsive CopG/Arc/MetJ family transcriptional regulator